MTTRVVGRGKCGKCGEEGSVVFKEISGKVYVYVKHGRKWCYIGPLESVDLSHILISLSDYHYFTTKINEYVNRLMRVGNVKITTLSFTTILLIILSYALSISSSSYTGYYWVLEEVLIILSQVAVVSAIFTSLLTVSLYEVRYKRTLELTKLLRGKHVLKQIVLITTTTILIFIFTPLSSNVNIECGFIVSVVDSRVERSIFNYISLSCILMTALVLTIVSRSVSKSTKEYIVNIILASILGAVLYFSLIVLSAWITYGYYMESKYVFSGIFINSRKIGFMLIAFSTIYTIAIHVFKKIIMLETI